MIRGPRGKRRYGTGPVRTVGPALLVCLILLAACAVVEAPPGGPIDTTPPWLVAVTPDSGAVELEDLRELSFTFSEKMDRQSATSWLYFFPDQRIRKTSWKGAVTANIKLENPLPPDTVVVVEIAGRMADAHKVQSRRARRFPLATGSEIPTGSIAGVLVMGDSAISRGVVELYDVPPDTLEYFQQPLLRRTSTLADGSYVFSWLPVPGGPWLLRAFVDADGNLRPAAAESKRLLPDTLSLRVDQPTVAAGVTTLYPVDTPGRLHIPPSRYFAAARPVMAWSFSTGDVDTGFVLQPIDPTRHPYAFVDPDSASVLREARPGLNRVGLFLDVDADSSFGVVPDSLLRAAADFAWTLADSAADTTGWYLEPVVVVTSPYLEPGLDASLTLPDTLPTVMPWSAPPPVALPDSAAADTTALPIDLPQEE
jgi:hypothetical protein